MTMDRRTVAMFALLSPLGSMASPTAAQQVPEAGVSELERLALEMACRNVSALYAHLIADHAFDRLGEVFAQDGLLEVAGTRSEGLAAITQFLSGSFADGAKARLIITNEIITVCDARQARGSAFFSIHRLNLQSGIVVPSLAPAAFATSEDIYCKTDAGWRLALRRIQLVAAAAQA
jgi:hypothetical protein